MRVGIVGCGGVGAKRAVCVGAHQIVVVADVDSQRARALASKVGADASEDWKRVITADVDAVIVAVPHDSLTPISLAAIHAGKHVLVEKPAARSVAELAPLAEAARSERRVVKVGYNHRFHPAVLQAHAMVEGGALGPLLFVRGCYGHGGRLGYEREWRLDPDRSGGGELLDQGSHLIDLARWFLGELALGYAATPTYFWDAQVDDNCFLALKAEGGQIAWLHASWTEWKNRFFFEIYGRDGKLTIDGLGGSYGTERLRHDKMAPEMGPPKSRHWEYPGPDRSWEREFAEFAAAIDEDRQPIGDLDDAMAALEIIEEGYLRGRQ